MTTREVFHDVMRQRRQWPKGSTEWGYLTRAARKLAWMVWGVPTTEWADRMQEFEQ